jgi:hypothetical protein
MLVSVYSNVTKSVITPDGFPVRIPKFSKQDLPPLVQEEIKELLYMSGPSVHAARLQLVTVLTCTAQ